MLRERPEPDFRLMAYVARSFRFRLIRHNTPPTCNTATALHPPTDNPDQGQLPRFVHVHVPGVLPPSIARDLHQEGMEGPGATTASCGSKAHATAPPHATCAALSGPAVLRAPPRPCEGTVEGRRPVRSAS